MKALMAILATVAVVVVAVLVLQPEPDPPATTASSSTTQPQPGPSGTPPPAEGLRRIRIDNWTWDAGSITLSITNTGDVFVSGTAQCRVEFGASGAMWPQIPLRGLQPGESWTETHRNLWAAGNAPTLVPECVVVSP